MNKSTRDIITEFNSPDNREYLATALVKKFNDPNVFNYLQNNFNDLVTHFIATIKEELYMSDPLPGVNIKDIVHGFNAQFIQDRSAFISVHILKNVRSDIYSVRDGDPTSRKDVKHYQQDANKILGQWKNDSGRGVQMRSDTAADFGTGETMPTQGMQTGVTFCDQSDIGTSLLYETLMNGTYFNKLNKFPLYNGAIGDGSYDNGESDARLLSRRSFRSNEAGVENGIPRYEQRLYVRNLDRDVRESMPGTERDCIIQKHDMKSLYCRTDKNRNKRY